MVVTADRSLAQAVVTLQRFPWYNDITMNKTALFLVAGATLSAALSACGGKTAANEKNFAVTVTQYFDKKGTMCLDPVKWPVDVYETDMRQQKLFPYGVAGQMAALEAVGLARSDDVELPGTVINGKANAVKVKRYSPKYGVPDSLALK